MSNLVVRTEAGFVEGFTKNRTKQWLGIPYGQAGRFEHSKPAAPWKEVLKCHDYAAKFYQPSSSTQALFGSALGYTERDVPQSEDAFFLNVFSPSNDSVSKLPVLVYIYGGSLNNGSASIPLYDGTDFVTRRNDCILVTFDYRTSVFGFLAHPDLKETSEDGLAGNYGVRDCMCALQWVKRNIAAFGGDPENVTLFGESAGAYITSVLLFSGQKLFNRAIMQSGGCGTIGTNKLNSSSLDSFYNDLLKDLDIKGSTAKDRVAALKQVPAEKLLTCANSRFSLGTWSLAVESGPNAIWKHSPVHSSMHGEYDPWIEAVIMGVDRDEGTLFSAGLGLQDPKNVQNFLQRYPEELRAAVSSLYKVNEAGADTPLTDHPATQMLGDAIFDAPFMHMAHQLTTVPNARSGKTIPVYGYQFQTTLSSYEQVPALKAMGVMHGMSELPFVFGQTSLLKTEGDKATSEAVGKQWCDFAVNGQPTNWPAFDAKSPQLLAFKANGETRAMDVSEWRSDKLAFWYKVIEHRASSTLEQDALPEES